MTPDIIPTGQKKLSFPRIADYNGVMRYWIEVCLEQKYIMPPKMTQHTLDMAPATAPTLSVLHLKPHWAV